MFSLFTTIRPNIFRIPFWYKLACKFSNFKGTGSDQCMQVNHWTTFNYHSIQMSPICHQVNRPSASFDFPTFNKLDSHFAALGFPESMKENKYSRPATSVMKQAKTSRGKFLTKSPFAGSSSLILQTLQATSAVQESACPKLVRVVISNRALESSCCCTWTI